ncbi:ParB/RepB/Spo0J family partition protein (plasmid) [Nocardia sp. NBC_01377]|uniref:hypothetical protein n=1 Tax=Nocardia sp. NBC_01377 TaxID=2903595 RepID=UPI002F919549
MTTFVDNPTTTDPNADLPADPGDLVEDSATTDEPTADTAQSAADRPEHGQVAGELLWLDPKKLKRARNRPVKPMDPDVKGSIIEHGNLLPLVTVRTAGGGFAVWDGWHRVELLRDTPHMALCAVYPVDTSAEQLEVEAERIVLQFNSGAHRYAQNQIDRADAVAQMLDLGFNLTETRKALVGVTSDEVRAVKKLTRSDAATQALYESDLDLVQAAAAAEHFGDDPDAIDELIDAAADGQFAHVLAQMLEERAELEAEERTAAAYAQAVAGLTEAGITVLETPLPEAMVALEDLLDTEGATPTSESVPLDYLAVVLVRQASVDGTDERIGVDLIDERTELFPEDDADPGMYHVAQVTVLDEFAPVYYCTDLDAAGLSRNGLDEDPFEASADASPTAPAEDEAAREARIAREVAAAERERERAEEASAKRAEATILNRHARAATKVRRTWLTTNLFGGQKTVPPGSLELIGRVVANAHLLTAHHAHGLASQLGAKVPNAASSDGVKARDNHGGLRTLLRVVAAMEAFLQPTSDSPDYYRRVSSLMGDYMRFLASHGYPLASVERVLTGELTKAEVISRPVANTTTTDGVTADRTEDATEEDGPEAEDPDEESIQEPADHDGIDADDGGAAESESVELAA